jgi:hypothetical protein
MALKPKKKSEGGTEDHADKQAVVNTLTSYWNEADNNRRAGLNPRDDKWKENLDLYWNRYDFSKKAPWQSTETMPEVPTFVDRFAAAMKEALVAVPEGFYTVVDPTDTEGDLSPKLKAMMDVWLTKCGTAPNGIPLSFPAVFEEQMKLGAIMACCASVTWKKDMKGGRVVVEAQDPRFVWFDHSGRNLYRIRRMEKERHALKELVSAKDSEGKDVFDLEEISALVGSIQAEDQTRQEELAGHGKAVTSPRQTITLDEYIADVIGSDGKLMYEGKTLNIVANGRFLVRGPEPIPLWHKQDWMVYSPLIPTPLSVYGRAYMEDFASVAKTFNELTNLILDAVYTTALKAFVLVPGLLLNPEQVATGITPNKMFLLDEGVDPRMFAQALDLGTLPPEAITAWQMMKNELREVAGMNEVGLGQFAPKGRTSATEVNTTQQSSSAIVRSVAQTVETRFLDPVLDLVWKTGLQFMDANDNALIKAASPEMFAALYARRKELVSAPTTFQARGISTMMQKSQKLQALLQVLQVIAQNEGMLQAFLQVADMRRLVSLIFQLSDIDLSKLQTSQREQMMRSLTEPLTAAGAPGEGAGPPAAPSSPSQAEAQDVARTLGVARG